MERKWNENGMVENGNGTVENGNGTVENGNGTVKNGNGTVTKESLYSNESEKIYGKKLWLLIISILYIII